MSVVNLELTMFSNPVLRSESWGDPFVVLHEGVYYLTGTCGAGDALCIWKSSRLSSFDTGEKVRVWKAKASGPASGQVWAPELHQFGKRWYLYFTASDGIDDHHRHYVLESEGDSPLGPYAERGRVDPEWEHYAIDGSILRLVDGRTYWMYCAGGLWIVEMESPTRVKAGARRVQFAAKTHDWESAWVQRDGVWHKGDGGWVEAPQALQRNGRTFVAYSAGHTCTPHYYVGLLELIASDPLDAASWRKEPEPILGPHAGAEGSVYSTGHNCFTKSPDGTEDWIVYHGRNTPWDKDDLRTVRAQRFAWRADGMPVFGKPVPAGVKRPRPSGETD